MLGAIAGDIIGSVYETRRRRIKRTDFPLFGPESTFTDDTVLTIATAEAILGDGDYAAAYRRLGRAWPHAGYGAGFRRWLASEDPRPYGSWGNGSAMRVSPVGWAFDDEDTVLTEARRSAAVTHDHPEGIKGAQAVAVAVFAARHGADKQTLRGDIARRFGYDLDRTTAAIRPTYRFDSSCQGSVPQAFICVLESTDYESAVRLAVSLGGDSDTLACIAGAVAEALYGPLPAPIVAETVRRLPPPFLNALDAFQARVRR
ncbi:MAG TPA: ADP-ribosylglycohydrolase family protein [Phycisphaerales bacterium]|nr:ADP-ribosylglycohydrolase family protein [Phycisphaerales bacterium]